MADKFWIEDDGEQEEFFIGEKRVGTFSRGEHGRKSMSDASRLFENTAKALGARFEHRSVPRS